jgi:hypothetical protein
VSGERERNTELSRDYASVYRAGDLTFEFLMDGIRGEFKVR